MNRYLIFRTDRIGDFLISAILIKSIKFNDPKSYIIIVASKKNYEYIKNFSYINEVILLENNFLSKIKTIFILRKYKFYNSIIIHDNKKRSKFISFFLNFKNKITLGNNEQSSHIDLIKNILKKLYFKFNERALDIIINKNSNIQTSERYILFHFDEKWIYEKYIKKYVKIEPSEIELSNFLVSLQSKTNKKIIITTGLETPILLKRSLKHLNNQQITLIENLDFINLQKKVFNSEILISCHGAISHVASACKIKQIDIIDKSYNYGRWTQHFRNYHYIYRNDFTNLSNQILDRL